MNEEMARQFAVNCVHVKEQVLRQCLPEHLHVPDTQEKIDEIAKYGLQIIQFPGDEHEYLCQNSEKLGRFEHRMSESSISYTFQPVGSFTPSHTELFEGRKCQQY